MSMLSNSISGLLAAQRALSTTSHNISNVNTEGYTRQRAEFSARTPQGFGNGFVGTGVSIDTVRRLYDQSREEALRSSSSEFKRLETFAGLAARVDNLLADADVGLSPAMQGFFDAVQEVAADPSSGTARRVLLTEGENLVGRLRFLDQRLSEIDTDTTRSMGVQVDEINEYAEGIAELNKEILLVQGRVGQPPNDLLDQRDKLVQQINQRIGAKVVAQDDGQYNVFIGNGQPLVTGSKVSHLTLVDNEHDKSVKEIALSTGNGAVNITRNLSGGTLGGMLDFRREVLEPTRNDLGRVAISLAMQFNEQHRQGVHFANGEAQMGGAFFDLSAAQPAVYGPDGLVDGAVSLDPERIGQLTGSDYRLDYDGSDWTLTRLSDNKTFTDFDEVREQEGLDIDTNALAANPNDSFLIRPTARAAGGIGMEVVNASEIAIAAPVVSGVATNADGTPANHGSGTVSVGVNSPQGLPLKQQDAIQVRYQGEELHIRMSIDGQDYEGTLSGHVPGESFDLRSVTFTSALGGTVPLAPDLSITLSGDLAEGDAFVIQSSGPGDNGNALDLGAIQEDSFLDGGASTLQQAYSGLVGDVGTNTMRAQINRDAQEVVFEQAQQQRDAYSGVNLDEEAANLLKFQQLYQASAQVITVANSVFQSLLQAVR